MAIASHENRPPVGNLNRDCVNKPALKIKIKLARYKHN
jgi:hypothetical protein